MYRKNVSGWRKHADFVFLDVLCVQLAYYLSYILYKADWNPYRIPLYRDMAIFIGFTDLMIILLFEVYKNVLERGCYREFFVAIKQGILLMLFARLYLRSVKNENTYAKTLLFLMSGFYVSIKYIVCLFWKRYFAYWMKKGREASLIIITNSVIAEKVIRNVQEHNYKMYRINGVIVLDKDLVGTRIAGVPVVANTENVVEFLCKSWVDEVFINIDEKAAYPEELLDRCTEMGLTVHLNLVKIQDGEKGKQSLEKVGPYTVLTIYMNRMTMGQALIKRTIDILAGIVGCILTGILFLFIAPMIYATSPGPIFFVQERVGKNGKVFRMYKFRSMYIDAEERKSELMNENKMKNKRMFKMDFDPRIIGNKILSDGTKKTGIGQFIRSTSLDEFPQFYNVLIGQMSLVGFRPVLLSEYKEYELHHRARMSMKPGITGMWQVSGRSKITDFEEVVELDTEYIRNWSIGLDIKIILKTVKTVFDREGAR